MYYLEVIIIIACHYKINSLLAAFLLLHLHSYYTVFLPTYQISLVFLLSFCFYGN